MVLLPETFQRLDHSKHAQVATCQVHPCNWSLLPSTVLSTFTCVLFHHACSITHTQVFQDSLGVLPNPQLVPPPQDCCAFWLVPLCTISTVEAVSRHMWLLPLPNVCHTHHNFCIPGWAKRKPHSPKHEWRLTSVVTRVCKCGCRKVSSEQMLSCTNGFTSGHRH